MADIGQATMRLEVVTPSRLVVSEEITELVAPGSEGYFGVLPGHLPFITTLKMGELTFWAGREEHHLAISKGYAEVRGDTVSILADSAERPEEIDLTRAERSRQRAEERLREWTAGKAEIDAARAEAALYRALARLQVARKGR
ncbi:MAG: F0F1 ATP synthase subunit epsilon [candidate division NC10 bacterium]|nr:F0F1 ATP synthase subunit epsilon [candidate division NC10 bacterium]